MRRQCTDWEKISAKDTSNKGLLSTQKKPKKKTTLLKLNNKKINNPIKKNSAKDMSRHHTKKT